MGLGFFVAAAATVLASDSFHLHFVSDSAFSGCCSLLIFQSLTVYPKDLGLLLGGKAHMAVGAHQLARLY